MFMIFSSTKFSCNNMGRSMGVVVASLDVAPEPIVIDADEFLIDFAVMQVRCDTMWNVMINKPEFSSLSKKRRSNS